MTRRLAMAAAALLAPTACLAATLHGRVKDQQCSVLAEVTVRIHSADGKVERTLTTDESGNYHVALPKGEYKLCFQRSRKGAPTCSQLSVTGDGDMWKTTQLRDELPDVLDLAGSASR